MAIDPIRHLVVLAHPRRGSFNHQIAQAYCDAVEACGQRAFLRDLYLNRFDPVLEYLGEAPELEVVYDLTEIRHCDVVVFVYPIWFGGPPAMIKGYVDRVLGAGFKPSHDREGVVPSNHRSLTVAARLGDADGAAYRFETSLR